MTLRAKLHDARLLMRLLVTLFVLEVLLNFTKSGLQAVASVVDGNTDKTGI